MASLAERRLVVAHDADAKAEPEAETTPVAEGRSEALRLLEAMLFASAKIGHLNLLPQGKPERQRRALAMVSQMNHEIFGNCTNIGECEAVCPKEIPISNIARMTREYIKAALAAGK